MIRCWRVGLGVGVVLVFAHLPAAAAADSDLTVAVVPGALTMTGGGGDVDLGRAELDDVNATLIAVPATLGAGHSPGRGSLGTIEATADMTLNAPTTSKPGAYRAVLTLTVI